MDYITLDSSNVLRTKYNNSTNELFVTFRSGSSYIYHDVPEHIFVNFINASSHGKYVHEVLKPNYRTSKIN